MPRYLLTIYQPDGEIPDPEILNRVGEELHHLNEDLKAAGAWVFTGGLHPPESARVIRPRVRDQLLTDGPYTEGKEHVGGLWIITSPNLETATTWARRAAEATTLPIEVREFHDTPEY